MKKKKRYDKLNDDAYSALKYRDCAANFFFKRAADALDRGVGVSIETTYNAKNHGDINPDGTKATTFEGENITLNDIVASFGKTAVIGKKLYSIDGYETRRPKYCIKVTDIAKNREGLFAAVHNLDSLNYFKRFIDILAYKVI